MHKRKNRTKCVHETPEPGRAGRLS